MTFWDFLHRMGPGWPSERGWYALALFIQTGVILALVATVPQLRNDEFFKSLATAIVITGWIGFAVGMKDNSHERENVGKALDVAAAAQPAAPSPDAAKAAEQVADAAASEADKIKDSGSAG